MIKLGNMSILIGGTCMRRKLRAYGEKEHRGHYVIDDYQFSHNHTKSITIRRWKRHLKQHARRYGKKTCYDYLVSLDDVSYK